MQTDTLLYKAIRQIIMNERCELKRYADNLSCILNMGSVTVVSERMIEANEQGFSGAALIRLDAVFDDGRQGSFLEGYDFAGILMDK